ncbi:MAG: hypothetical protein K0R82_2415 [Flavipsychrobacter sp.]|nr:hypothetical protein [Flavipsychrobacter sp.]
MFLHFLFLLIFFIFSIFSSETALSILLSVHAAAMLFERHIVRRLRLDPLTCYGIYSILVGIANIVLMRDLATDSVPYGYNYVIPAHIHESIGIFFAGNAFLFIGYELFSQKSLPSIALVMESRKNHKILFYAMLFLSFQTMFFPEGILGSLTTILSVFSSVGIIFFSRLWGKFDDKTYRNYAITLFALQTIYAILYSYLRIAMLAPTLSLALGYFVGRGSLRILWSYRLIPLLLAFFIFNLWFSFLGENRTVYGEVDGFRRLDQMMTLANVDKGYEDKDGKESILYRSSVLPQLTNVVGLVKTKGFFNGDASAPLLIALIPRFLWPEKPLIGLGAWFATEIGMGLQTDSWYTNSINMTIQGHLFLDFGYLGVILGCILMGGCLALLWNSTDFYKSAFNLTGVTLGGYLLMMSLTGIGADLQILITLISYYLIFIFLKKVL